MKTKKMFKDERLKISISSGDLKALRALAQSADESMAQIIRRSIRKTIAEAASDSQNPKIVQTY